MIYTVKEYCAKFNIHPNTFNNRRKKGTLPSFHKVKELNGRGYVIEVDHCELCEITEKAMREYNRLRGSANNPELAAELSIKYKINTAKMFRMCGL